MMLLNGYTSKKDLKSKIGSRLNFTETSMLGAEYVATGKFIAAHRPRVTGGKGREFFAEITMQDNLSAKVS